MYLSRIDSRLFEFDPREFKRIERILVVGDIHGDYDSLRRIIGLVDMSRDFIVFLGDYADRGLYGVEVIDTISSLLEEYSGRIVALKGNHEDYSDDGEPRFYPCDLVYEAERKKGGWMRYFVEEFKLFIERLYLAAMIPGEILMVHGGVSSRIKSISDLRYPSLLVERDVLWSDPWGGYGEYPSRRGAGVEFGIDITEEVCARLGIKMIVRSHEPMKALSGPCYEHNGRVVTVSSTRVYGGKPFILVLDPETPTNISHIFV
ncbi:MAG: metallophosphoesterase family protein [Candidatus Bathyarchaeia archaeon]